MRLELLPYLLLTRSAERMYRKPRGYAGDFLTIAWMYADEPGGAGELGCLLDRAFLNQPAAKAVRNRRGLRLERRNLLHLCIGRQHLELEPQHLIYSIGLIDYFDDRIVTRLQGWIHSCLAPGGRSILGNFHTSNPTRGLMDHLLDWRLIHRDEADMLPLAQAAGFASDATRCCFEPAGVNLFSVSQR